MCWVGGLDGGLDEGFDFCGDASMLVCCRGKRGQARSEEEERTIVCLRDDVYSVQLLDRILVAVWI